MKKTAIGALVLITLGGCLAVSAGEPGNGDWPMWGGTADRNLVSSMKGLPVTWDVKTKKGVKWVAELGSQTYGNPVVANGVVLVGTNNEAMKDPAIKGDKGIVMAFRESDGQFLWQAVHDKLAQGRANDWPFQGVCSSPLVENGMVLAIEPMAALGSENILLAADNWTYYTADGSPYAANIVMAKSSNKCP